MFAGVNGQSRAAANTYMRALQPRFGAAYKLNEKLVVRGGWGRYYLNPSNSYIQSTGFSTSTPLVSSLDGGRTPISESAQQSLSLGPAASSGVDRRSPDECRPGFDRGESELHPAPHGPVFVWLPVRAAQTFETGCQLCRQPRQESRIESTRQLHSAEPPSTMRRVGRRYCRLSARRWFRTPSTRRRHSAVRRISAVRPWHVPHWPLPIRNSAASPCRI